MKKGAELPPEPSPLLTELCPSRLAAIDTRLEELEALWEEEDLETTYCRPSDILQHLTEEEAQQDLLLQLALACEVEQSPATGVGGASLAPAPPAPKPEQRGRLPAAEQAAALVSKAAAAKPRRRSRQPAAEQAPAICAPAAPEGATSVVKEARQKSAKPRATPQAGAAAPAEPAAGLLMLQQEPLMEQQVRCCTPLM